jgi:hypothetical protein
MNPHPIRCAAAALAISALSLFAGSAVAFADGGQTIATATPVVLGQLELGNTLNGGVTTDGLNGFESYWALNVTNGDDVTIAWQAPLDVSGNGPLLSAYDVGTDDSSVLDASPSQSEPLGADGTDAMTFTADATGVMPLQFESGVCCSESVPGPYQFTATVTHAVALTLPNVSSLAAKGTIPVSVANPDGLGVSDPTLAVELQVQAAGQAWTTIGTASASGGAAKISYTVPASLAGKTVKLQALAQGAAYQTQTSSSQSVSVAASGSATGPGSGSGSGPGSGRGTGSRHARHPGLTCLVPRLVGKKLHPAEQALRNTGCRLGHVRGARATHGRKGRVVAQSQTAGARRHSGTRVNLVVGH